MTYHPFIKPLTISIVLGCLLYSCNDGTRGEEPMESKTDLFDESFGDLMEADKDSVPTFEFPAVEMKKIKALKKAGDYGYSELFYYISANFKSLHDYNEQGATEDFEIFGHSFEGDVHYETAIHRNEPRHFVETFTFPSMEMEDVKNILLQIFPDVQFDCEEKTKYCTHTLYGALEARTVFFQNLGETTKIGISYRNI